MNGIAPWHLFGLAFVVSGLGGIGVLFLSNEPITVRKFLGTLLVHGCCGSGLGMVGYEYLGWNTRQRAIVGFAALYGVGIFSFAEIKSIARRLLGTNQGGNSHGTTS